MSFATSVFGCAGFPGCMTSTIICFRLSRGLRITLRVLTVIVSDIVAEEEAAGSPGGDGKGAPIVLLALAKLMRSPLVRFSAGGAAEEGRAAARVRL